MRTFSCFALLLVVASLASSQPSQLACSWSPSTSPAFPVPAGLWGQLEPVDPSPLPSSRDTTDFDQLGDFEAHPYWVSVDATGGHLLAAAGRRLQIWSLSNPAAPTRLWDRGFRDLTLTWTPDAHAFYIFEDLEASDDGALLAVGGRYGMGLAVWNTTSKTSPTLIYQDHGNGRTVSAVSTTRIAGRSYAIAGATQEGGAFLYDLTAAAAQPIPCTEARPANPGCFGVYLGKLGDHGSVASVAAVGELVALATFTGVEVWSAATPTAPRLRASLPGALVIEMFEANGTPLLAARTVTDLFVYDVSCALSGPCPPLSPIAVLPLAPSGSPTLTASVSEGIPFLHAGDRKTCTSSLQQEWLFDMRFPPFPRDITPPGTITLAGRQVSYGSWYNLSPSDPLGFNYFAPRQARFSGSYLYRAGHSILDIHRRSEPELPSIELLSVAPAAPSVCDTVLASATVAGEEPLSYSWSLIGPLGLSVATGTGTTLSWSAVGQAEGTYTLTLSLSNPSGVAIETTTFPLAGSNIQPPSPAPAVTITSGSTVLATLPTAGVQLWTWMWGDGTETVLVGDFGASATHTYAAQGTYSVRVRMDNCADSVLSAPKAVTITQVTLEVLEFAARIPVVCLPNGPCYGSVGIATPFTLEVLGGPQVYEYDWNGDGTNDQISGSPLSHRFRAPGTYRPTVTAHRAPESVTRVHPYDIIINGGTEPAPQAPQNLSLALFAGNALRMSWSDVADEDGYWIDYRLPGGAWSPMVLLAVDRTELLFTPPFSPPIDMRVRAVNDAGEGVSASISYIPPGLIFADGFESGTTAAWDRVEQ